MIGTTGNFGPQIDFSQTFAQDYVAASNRYWLDEYHVDGFRYDEVTDLYLSPTDTGYAKLVYDTYRYSFSIPRFQRGRPPTAGSSSAPRPCRGRRTSFGTRTRVAPGRTTS